MIRNAGSFVALSRMRLTVAVRDLALGSTSILLIPIVVISAVAAQSSPQADTMRHEIYVRFADHLLAASGAGLLVVFYFGTRASPFRRAPSAVLWQMRSPNGIRHSLLLELVALPFLITGPLATTWLLVSSRFADPVAAIKFGVALATIRCAFRCSSFTPGVLDSSFGDQWKLPIGVALFTGFVAVLLNANAVAAYVNQGLLAPVLIPFEPGSGELTNGVVAAAIAGVWAITLASKGTLRMVPGAYSLSVEMDEIHSAITNRTGQLSYSRAAKGPVGDGFHSVLWAARVFAQRGRIRDLQFISGMLASWFVIFLVDRTVLWIAGLAWAAVIVAGSVNQSHVHEIRRQEARPPFSSFTYVLSAMGIPFVRTMGLLTVPLAQIITSSPPLPFWLFVVSLPGVAALAVVGSGAFILRNPPAIAASKTLILVSLTSVTGPSLASNYSGGSFGSGAGLGMVITMLYAATAMLFVTTSRVKLRQ